MFETQKKRVVTLYRVSSKTQVTFNNNVGDIPLQQRECKQFIESKPDWELVEEYRELGVSGFKKKSNERDVLQQILLDAKKGKFDVILAFMFDRFGRRHDDTPFFIQELVKTGVEVWTVKEGQQTFNSHIDELMAFIRSWQSSGESGKTATRVTAAHKALVEDGMYRGGSPPFGYRLELASELNKKGKPVLKMAIDPEEAEIVKWIYNLADTLGYGQLRIARTLNEKGVLTKTGTTWTASTVNYMLKNPMYKGIFTFGRRTKDAIFSKVANPELIIIR
jgi:site-specific DNA recombinase